MLERLTTVEYFTTLYQGDVRYDVLRYWAELDDTFNVGDLYEHVVARWQIENDEERVRVLEQVTELLTIVGAFEGALSLVRQRIELATRSGDRMHEATAHRNMGALLTLRGEYARAREALEQARAIDEVLKNHKGVADTVGLLGTLYSRRGEYDRALECYRQQEMICGDLDDQLGLALVIGNRGLVHLGRGEYQLAIECFRRKEGVCRELGDRKGLAVAVGNLGLAYAHLAEYNTALECYHQQESICRELGDRSGLARVLFNIGTVYGKRGQYEAALRYYHDVNVIYEEIRDPAGVMRVIGNVGTVHLERGELELAMECFRQVAELAGELGERNVYAIAMGSMGMAYSYMGENAAALECFTTASNEHREIGVRGMLSDWLCMRGEVLLDLVRDATEMPEFLLAYLPRATADSWRELCVNAARTDAEEGIALSEALAKSDTIVSGRVLRARITAAEGDVNAAVASMQSMLAAATADDEQRAMVYYWLWKLTSDTDYHAEALRLYQVLYKSTPKHTYCKRVDELTAYVT